MFSVWGLIGATLVLVSGLVTIFGGIAFSPIADLLNFPNFVCELVLAVWLIIKGFNSSAITSESVNTDNRMSILLK
ncbi:MAG: DUF4386 family protein [Candidatus Hermodarchaeota archaeon]